MKMARVARHHPNKFCFKARSTTIPYEEESDILFLAKAQQNAAKRR